MESKDFESIMKEITRGLTGNFEQDISYLNEQMEKYKGHEYEKEILRACGRLIYEIMPEDKKKELEEMVSKDTAGFDAAMEEIQFNIHNKKYDRALKMMESMVEKYEKLNMYADDNVSEYYDFNELFEEVLYVQLHSPKKDVRRSQIEYTKIYYQYGSLLMDLQRYEDAARELEKAMRWNPSNARIAFEYAETFKARGMIEEYYTITKKIHKIIFHDSDLARYYRNLGYYYVEKQDLQTAVCCYIYSTIFEGSNIAQSELYYISTLDSSINMDPEVELLEDCFESNDIPSNADDDIIAMAYHLTKSCMENGNKSGAEYFISILLNFIETDEIRSMNEEINKM